jgi:hypothetical protein
MAGKKSKGSGVSQKLTLNPLRLLDTRGVAVPQASAMLDVTWVELHRFAEFSEFLTNLHEPERTSIQNSFSTTP